MFRLHKYAVVSQSCSWEKKEGRDEGRKDEEPRRRIKKKGISTGERLGTLISFALNQTWDWGKSEKGGK